ncbi:DNA gyrase subunit A [Mycobacteroides abscessus subsp. abscessus]|nr:DNA gyrase subunit A [Mycobacteroides abscessus subsp. abscessus]
MAVKVVTGEEDIMLITTGGVLIRMAVGDISTMGRNTQGVRLIRINDSEGEYVATVAKVEKEEEKLEEALAEEEEILDAETTEETAEAPSEDENFGKIK